MIFSTRDDSICATAKFFRMFHVGIGVRHGDSSDQKSDLFRSVRRWESKFTSDPLVLNADAADLHPSCNIPFPSILCEVKLFRDYAGLLEGVPFDILPAQRGRRVLMLGIPGHLEMQSLMTGFDSDIQCYSELKRSEEKSNFDRSVLFVFKKQGTADKFYRDWHIQFFDSNSTSGPVCYLAFIDKLFVHGSETEEYRKLLPVGSKQIPSCPLCIERIDVTVSGIITSRRGWLSGGSVSSSSCEACSNLSDEKLNCSQCRMCISTGLWLCLLCGNIGCGRYAKGHAEGHSALTGHRLSLEISTGRIWDYISDQFVHRRIVTSQASAPILDLPERLDPSSLPVHPQVSFQEDVEELDKTMSEQLQYERSKYEEACTQLKALGVSRVQCERDLLEQEKEQERQLEEYLAERREEISCMKEEVRKLRLLISDREKKLDKIKRRNNELVMKIKREKNHRSLEQIPTPKLDELNRLLTLVEELRLKVSSIV